jgi:hypothetical protein
MVGTREPGKEGQSKVREAGKVKGTIAATINHPPWQPASCESASVLIKAAGGMEVTQSQAGCDCMGEEEARSSHAFRAESQLDNVSAHTHTHTYARKHCHFTDCRTPSSCCHPICAQAAAPSASLQGQTGQGRQLLINILHIKNSVKPVSLEGQELCKGANWCHGKYMRWPRSHLPQSLPEIC